MIYLEGLVLINGAVHCIMRKHMTCCHNDLKSRKYRKHINLEEYHVYSTTVKKKKKKKEEDVCCQFELCIS